MASRPSTTRRGCLVVTAVIALQMSTAAPALAQGCVGAELEDCTPLFSTNELTEALHAEDLRTDCEAIDIVLFCVDGDVQIQSLDASQQSRHELATVPRELRPRVVALLVIERLRQPASWPTVPRQENRARIAPPAEALTPPPPPSGESPSAAPRPPPTPDGLERQALIQAPTTEATQAPATEAIQTPATEATRAPVTEAMARPASAPSALWQNTAEEESRASSRLGLDLYAAMVAFGAPRTVLFGGAARLSVDALLVEVGWARRVVNNTISRAHVNLGDLAGGVRLGCWSRRRTALCGSGLATLGYVRLRVRDERAGTVRKYHRVSLGAALELSSHWTGRRVRASVAVQAAYRYGVIANADGEALAALGGASFLLRVGLSIPNLRGRR